MTTIEDAIASLIEFARELRDGEYPLDAEPLAGHIDALIAEHERLAEELSEAHAHFAIQEGRIREPRAEIERLTAEGSPADDEREALAHLIADASAHPAFPRPSTAAPFNADYRAADAVLKGGFRRRQEPITEETKRLVYEVKMMLSSVASHGPAALTTTDDRMYTANLLARLRDALEAAERAR